MKNQGFTLIELLVVVLIIGILAAIAVPQYQVAVAKSEYSNLKVMSKAIAQAVNAYVLATGQQPTSFKDLDITLPTNNSDSLKVELANGNICGIWPNNLNTACFNGTMGFYVRTDTLKPELCYFILWNSSKAEIGEKICQQETGKDQRAFGEEGQYAIYRY